MSEEQIAGAVVDSVLNGPHRHLLGELLRPGAVRYRIRLEPGFDGNWTLDLSGLSESQGAALTKIADELGARYCCPMPVGLGTVNQ